MAVAAAGALATAFAGGGSALAGTAIIGNFTFGAAAKIGFPLIARQLFRPKLPDIEGQVLANDDVTSSLQGTDLYRVYGLAMVASNIAWASRYKQVTTEQEVGGKGAPSQTQRTNEYFVSISYTIAERIDEIETAFFDTEIRELSEYDFTLYDGVTNIVDPVMAAVEGVENVNPIHGLAHVVFNELPLTPFNNRPPQVRMVARRELPENTLPEILKAIMADDGIDIDVSQVPNHPIRGAAFGSISTPRSRFTSVAAPRLIDLVERPQGQLAAVPRFGLPTHSFSWQDLVVENPGDLPVNVTREGPASVPSRVHLAAPNPDRDYDTVTSTPSLNQEGELAEVSTPEVLTESENLVLANNAMLDKIIRRTKITCTLPPSVLLTDVDVGSIISIEDKDGTKYNVQITSASFGSGMAIEAETVLPVDPTYDAGAGSDGITTGIPLAPVAPIVAIMDLPWTPGAPSEYGVYIAATSDPFYTLAVHREQLDSGGADHDFVTTIVNRATMGVTSTTLAVGEPGAWAAGQSIDITLERGEFTSRPQEQVEANNLNALALQASDGTWEVIQFASAALTGENAWRLSNLRRGRGGISKDIPVGARAVLLSAATITPLDIRSQDLGVSRTYEVGPARLPIGDATYVSVDHTAQDRGRVPLPVLNVSITFSGGFVTTEWTRENQPNEVSVYLVNIYDGASVVEQYRVNNRPKHAYGPDNQVDDLGAELVAGDTFKIGISEINDVGLIGPEVIKEQVLS